MKNIHVLPTENESRLRYNSFNKVYELCEFPRYHTDIKSTHHIYITSDEEIKEDEYYLGEDNNIYCLVTTVNHNGKKIILTTDQDLVADGIQPIPDEFLEWFVKNPICEEVGVEKEHDDTVPYPKMRYVKPHKIIIQKEETKQEVMKQTAVEWLEMMQKKHNKLSHNDFKIANGMENQHIIDAYWEGSSNWDSEKEAEQYYNETFKN